MFSRIDKHAHGKLENRISLFFFYQTFKTDYYFLKLDSFKHKHRMYMRFILKHIFINV
mgnify:CR=1 FL=1